jgi:hypothetical protein
MRHLDVIYGSIRKIWKQNRKPIEKIEKLQTCQTCFVFDGARSRKHTRHTQPSLVSWGDVKKITRVCPQLKHVEPFKMGGVWTYVCFRISYCFMMWCTCWIVLQNVGRFVFVSTYATATAGVDLSYNELSDAVVSMVTMVQARTMTQIRLG